MTADQYDVKQQMHTTDLAKKVTVLYHSTNPASSTYSASSSSAPSPSSPSPQVSPASLVY